MSFLRCHNRYCATRLPAEAFAVRGEVFCSEACRKAEGRLGTVVKRGETPQRKFSGKSS